MNGENNKGKPLARKSSIKNKKPPEVRQTLTSKYRLLKANPLLMKAIASTQDDKEILLKKPLKTLASVMGNSCEVLNGKLSLQNNSTTRESVAPKSSNNQKKNIEILSKPTTSFNPINVTKTDFTSDKKFLTSTVLQSNKRESIKKMNMNHNIALFNKDKPSINRGIKQEINKKPPTSTSNIKDKKDSNKKLQPEKPKPLRRSLSAEHFDRKKKESFEQLRIINVHPTRSQSSEKLKIKNNEKEHNCSPITEERSSLNTVETPTPEFKTPLAYDRRSIKTPNTTNNRRSLFLSTPTSNELSERLNNWLKKRGKSLGDYHHLKCFGIHNRINNIKIVDEENKENIESSPKSVSYEDLMIIVPQNKEEIVEKKVNLEMVAKEALQDLHKLISEGYPSDQCEVWLRLIKQKYSKLEEDPQYWECRAAIEQSKGNINLAVECYKTAIVQGAEVQAVDQSLDQLLQKFSLLNINSKEGNTQDRTRIVQDARNIFKSSIIQFAVQERKLKKNNKDNLTAEKRFTATPVRRSTRLSRSAYTSTPGVALYSSLLDVDDNVKQSMNFRHNKALLE